MINFYVIGLELTVNVSQTEICYCLCIFLLYTRKNIINVAVRLDIGITITSTYVIKEGAAQIKKKIFYVKPVFCVLQFPRHKANN